MSVAEQFGDRLGDDSNRRTVSVTPFSPEELTPEGRNRIYSNGEMKWLATMSGVGLLPEEHFVVVLVENDSFRLPLEEFIREGSPEPVEYIFAITDQERVIGLKVRNPWNLGPLLEPVPMEQIINEIVMAKQALTVSSP